jgi:hypothetical protein
MQGGFFLVQEGELELFGHHNTLHRDHRP